MSHMSNYKESPTLTVEKKATNKGMEYQEHVDYIRNPSIAQ